MQRIPSLQLEILCQLCKGTKLMLWNTLRLLLSDYFHCLSQCPLKVFVLFCWTKDVSACGWLNKDNFCGPFTRLCCPLQEVLCTLKLGRLTNHWTSCYNKTVHIGAWPIWNFWGWCRYQYWGLKKADSWYINNWNKNIDTQDIYCTWTQNAV